MELSSAQCKSSITITRDFLFDAFNKMRVSGCSIKALEFLEGADSIYKGFNHEEVKEQFLMRPYGGFKIIADLVIKQNGC